MAPRSFVRTAALCVLGMSVLSFTHAEAAASPLASSTTPCGVSDDDQSSGIRAVDDSTCVKGGLGCYNDHCRFCKVLDTPQSTHFQSCSSLGADFPTMAPLVAPTTLCQVSSGDAAVGISAVTDPDCLYGGLGCFQSHCRFCKVKTTPQSAGFIPCSSFDISASVPVQSTVAPAVTTAAPIASTETPVSTTAAPATCTIVPAVGDVAVGVGIATDPSCQSGGLGCISDICRFCKVTTSVQSAAYVDCASIDGGAPVSEAPTVTAAPVSDISTEAPDVTTNSPDSTTDAPVVTTEAPVVTTEAPVVTTEAPVSPTETPVLTTDAPAPQSSCSLVAAAGDVAAGINIVTDPTCQSGGVGCIDDICRFCKVTTSVQSAAFIDCALFDGGEPTSEPPTASTAPPSDAVTETPDWTTDAPDATTDAPDATTEAPVSITEAPVSSTDAPDAATDAPDAVTDAPVSITDAPVSITDAPVSITETPDATTDAPVSITESPVAQPTCSIVASAGDVAVGVSIVSDPSCSSGGVGCIDDVCRFCKVRTSVQSAAFVDCALIAGATTASEAPTATADSTTDAPAPTTCSLVASSGDAAVGISIGTDSTCSLGGIGCINDVCRFCKMTTSTQSASFVDCTSIADAFPSSEAPVDTTPSPTDLITDPPTPQASCNLTVSEGDAAVGINIVADASCSLGGIGCIDNVCRFCKVTTSVQSASFVDCASIAGATVSTKAPADSTTTPSADPITSAPVPQASCSLVVSEGDAAVGIDIVADASCRLGGIGCIDNVCRFCKVTTSVQSAAFVDCASIVKSATSSEAPTTSPSSATTGDSTTTTPDTPDATTPDATDAPTDAPDATSAADDVATDAPNATDATTTSGPAATTDATTDTPSDAPTDTPDATEAPDSTTTDAPNAASDAVGGPDSNAVDTDVSHDSGDNTDAPDHPSNPTDTPTDAPSTTTDATDAPGEMDTPVATTTPGATTTDTSDTTTSTTSTTTTGTTGAPVDAPADLSSDSKDGSDDLWDADVPDDASDASSGSTDFDLDF
ncbi:hypothetical protein BBJ28_00000067 [Nothophytophthora sp. Chile5]|nr:hypothetical protein BBJ28_00000067 [Nothophytophthora sp. Chile5]